MKMASVLELASLPDTAKDPQHRLPTTISTTSSNHSERHIISQTAMEQAQLPNHGSFVSTTSTISDTSLSHSTDSHPLRRFTNDVPNATMMTIPVEEPTAYSVESLTMPPKDDITSPYHHHPTYTPLTVPHPQFSLPFQVSTPMSPPTPHFPATLSSIEQHLNQVNYPQYQYAIPYTPNIYDYTTFQAYPYYQHQGIPTTPSSDDHLNASSTPVMYTPQLPLHYPALHIPLNPSPYPPMQSPSPTQSPSIRQSFGVDSSDGVPPAPPPPKSYSSLGLTTKFDVFGRLSKDTSLNDKTGGPAKTRRVSDFGDGSRLKGHASLQKWVGNLKLKWKATVSKLTRKQSREHQQEQEQRPQPTPNLENSTHLDQQNYVPPFTPEPLPAMMDSSATLGVQHAETSNPPHVADGNMVTPQSASSVVADLRKSGSTKRSHKLPWNNGDDERSSSSLELKEKTDELGTLRSNKSKNPSSSSVLSPAQLGGLPTNDRRSSWYRTMESEKSKTSSSFSFSLTKSKWWPLKRKESSVRISGDSWVPSHSSAVPFAPELVRGHSAMTSTVPRPTTPLSFNSKRSSYVHQPQTITTANVMSTSPPASSSWVAKFSTRKAPQELIIPSTSHKDYHSFSPSHRKPDPAGPTLPNLSPTLSMLSSYPGSSPRGRRSSFRSSISSISLGSRRSSSPGPPPLDSPEPNSNYYATHKNHALDHAPSQPLSMQNLSYEQFSQAPSVVKRALLKINTSSSSAPRKLPSTASIKSTTTTQTTTTTNTLRSAKANINTNNPAPSISVSSTFGIEDSDDGYRYKVLSSHIPAPNRKDELGVEKGDLVGVYCVFEDAWAFGWNVTSGELIFTCDHLYANYIIFLLGLKK
jgi:hypothetical protein